MSKAAENLTPMMRQYLEIKDRHQDAILFFRLGDFYEMFFEDAVKASQILDIALTSRNKNEESSVPLCGIPYHSAGAYIRKLIEEGLKVAICEQVEDPKLAKGIVKREVTRVITPGLLVEDEGLASGEANYLAAFAQDGQGFHIGLLDISTGEVLVGFYEEWSQAAQELVKHQIKEVLLSEGDGPAKLAEELRGSLSRLLVSRFSGDSSDVAVLDEATFSRDLLESRDRLSSSVSRELVDRLLSYVHRTQRSVLRHLGPLHVLRERQYMRMDERTFRHLELTRNIRGEGRQGTLYWVLNKTMTAMGGRRLAKWIHYPLLNLSEIRMRLDAVEELFENPELNFSVQERLKSVQDVERMLGKLALATVHGRDLYGLGLSLKQAQALVGEIQPRVNAELLKGRLKSYPDLSPLFESLLTKLLPEAPLTVREGGMIAEGVHDELDELRRIRRDGKSVIAAMETEERRRTGISSLKIRYNKVFGYYIEITHTHRDSVPEDYIRKQTLANAERFITPKLKEYENKVLSAEERIKSLEYELFCGLREECIRHLESLREVAETLGTLDVLASLARVARDNRYSRPVLCEERMLDLKESRHPVLEKIHSENRFIPNDIVMDEEKQRLILITGPNMAGKSTVMRQVALTFLLAQLGSFVPAKEAKVGLVDQLFTRIGASDDLSQGQSTFMVEMLEAAHILKSATRRSFIVLDEIGRGTSTYDGMSIAWAIAEYVGKKIGCRALFATHYHELTDLSEAVPGVVNYQVAVKEWNGEILFLRKLIPGGASRSYGIEVARLAGLPEEMLTRAKQVLHRLESLEGQALQGLEGPNEARPQLDLFSQRNQQVIDALNGIQPDAMSPLEALNFLYKIKKDVNG
jgi:DNA mismatch repair protein MutS